jgi:uncharacterized membrane protein YcjF (UPF0283 family)
LRRVKKMSSLTPRRIEEIERLMARLKADQVPLEEARQSQETLEQEKQEAFDRGDVLLGLALLLLGASLVMYLARWIDST